MTDIDALKRDLASDVPRPATRVETLPRGPALLDTLTKRVLEIWSWSDGPNEPGIGDWNHLIVSTAIAGQEIYLQLLSEPGEPELVFEVASGFYAGDSADALRATDAQRAEMVSRGFTDGRAGNFRKHVRIEVPSSARALAEEILDILTRVFASIDGSPLEAKLHRGSRVRTRHVFEAVSPDDVLELLRRHGLEARAEDLDDDEPTFAAALGGHRFTVHLTEKAENSSRFETLVLRAQAGTQIPVAATNPFNALSSLGRSWVDDSNAYLESSLRIAGVSEQNVHDWLDRWATTLATACYWYRRVERAENDEQLALQAHHFDPSFSTLDRIIRALIEPSQETAAMNAFVEECRIRPSGEGSYDAWAFFERYSATHPEAAMPVVETFHSPARPDDIERWCTRIDGLRVAPSPSPKAQAGAESAIAIEHVVPCGTLRITLAKVRQLRIDPERLALAITVEGDDADIEIAIGREDFYFAPLVTPFALGGATFHAVDLPATVSWFETKQRLRALESDLAWAGPLLCGHQFAWLIRALDGAHRVGLDASAFRKRFDRLLEAAEQER